MVSQHVAPRPNRPEQAIGPPCGTFVTVLYGGEWNGRYKAPCPKCKPQLDALVDALGATYFGPTSPQMIFQAAELCSDLISP
ncbi:hypothetical protein [Schlesneria sp. DSM 10557]|uniref:hypothetical protein n=1 Tax=Schlesneria sp. DSM 10557 TaxID=3044399 RepID=UPI00359F79CA